MSKRRAKASLHCSTLVQEQQSHSLPSKTRFKLLKLGVKTRALAIGSVLYFHMTSNVLDKCTGPLSYPSTTNYHLST